MSSMFMNLPMIISNWTRRPMAADRMTHVSTLWASERLLSTDSSPVSGMLKLNNIHRAGSKMIPENPYN